MACSIKLPLPEREGVDLFVQLRVKGDRCSWALNATLMKLKAVDAGASVWVHAYNGMRGLTHRELSMVGAMYCLIPMQN